MADSYGLKLAGIAGGIALGAFTLLIVLSYIANRRVGRGRNTSNKARGLPRLINIKGKKMGKEKGCGLVIPEPCVISSPSYPIGRNGTGRLGGSDSPTSAIVDYYGYDEEKAISLSSSGGGYYHHTNGSAMTLKSQQGGLQHKASVSSIASRTSVRKPGSYEVGDNAEDDIDDSSTICGALSPIIQTAPSSTTHFGQQIPIDTRYRDSSVFVPLQSPTSPPQSVAAFVNGSRSQHHTSPAVHNAANQNYHHQGSSLDNYGSSVTPRRPGPAYRSSIQTSNNLHINTNSNGQEWYRQALPRSR